MLRNRCGFLAAVITNFIVNVLPSFAFAQSPGTVLKVLDTWRIGGAMRWDYPVFDEAANRLYIACGNHVQVIDTKEGKVVGDIADLQGTHGTAIVTEKNLGFITAGRENAVAVFDLKTLKATRKISSPGNGGRNPDAIIYDPASKKVFAMCAGGDAVVIDPANLDAAPVSIACGGKLEYGRADGKGHVFINNEDKSEIDVIDTKEMKLTNKWPIAPAEGPSGLAIDTEHHRLFAVGGNAKMAVVDYETGKVLADVPIGKGTDGCAYDAKLGVALSSNGGDGTVTVVGETSPGKFAAVQTLATQKTGRTIANDPTTSRFFIPATIPGTEGNPAGFGLVVVGAAK